MKKTRKSLLLAVISLVLSISMLLGITWAWFTDSATSGKNKIIGGNLDVDLVMDKAEDGNYTSIADVEAAIFGGENSIIAQNKSNDTLWEPGKTQIVYLGVRNLGTLALKYDILLKVTDGGLASALEYAIIDGATKATMTAEDWTELKNAASVNADVTAGTFPACENGTLDEVVNGEENETDYFALAVHMKEDADNTYMDKDITIDVEINATQYTAESDSFNNQYDKGALSSDDEPEDDPDALWFNKDVSGATPSDVTSIVFTKTAPEKSAYDSTWKSPANSVAYYNSTSKALTYVPNGDSFKMTDANLLKISGNVVVKGFGVTDEEIINWANENLEGPYTTVEEICIACEVTREFIESFIVGEDYCFSDVASVTGLELWNVSTVTDFSDIFSATPVTTLDISGWDTSSAVNMSRMFYDCSELTEIKLGAKWNTSKVANMSHLFYKCKKLTKIDSDKASWDTSKVTDMSSMFDGCAVIEALPTTGWNTSSLQNMESMFCGCHALTALDVSSFDTSNVTNMYGVFWSCYKLESLNLQNWNTASVKNMNYMFSFCQNMASVDLSSFDTSEVTTMQEMFANCEKLTVLDLSSFNTSKVSNMRQMFTCCYKLEHIYVGSGWNTEAVPDTVSGVPWPYSAAMFYSCTKLPNFPEYWNVTALIDKTHAYVGEDGYLETKPAS